MIGLGGITGARVMRKYYRASYRVGRKYGVHYLLATSNVEAKRLAKREVQLEFPSKRNIQIISVTQVSKESFKDR
jgi:hypothetical protein